MRDHATLSDAPARFGQEEGLEFSELLSIRLRGSVSVSPLGLYREGAS
jgi:hypothetical protein